MSGGIERLPASNAESIKEAGNVLSAPFPAGLGILSSQSMGQVDLVMAMNHPLLVRRADPGEVVLEQRRQSGGNGCEPILVALARTDDELFHLEIEVLAPEPDAFPDAQATPVEKSGNQLGGPVHQGNDTGDFFACHDHGDIHLFWGTNGIDFAIHGMVEESLIEERNTRAFIAWFWMAEATFPSTDRWGRNTSILRPGGKRSSRDRIFRMRK